MRGSGGPHKCQTRLALDLLSSQGTTRLVERTFSLRPTRATIKQMAALSPRYQQFMSNVEIQGRPANDQYKHTAFQKCLAVLFDANIQFAAGNTERKKFEVNFQLDSEVGSGDKE